MTMADLYTPFAEFAFMRRALAACIILSVSAAPLGVFLSLRRMSLVGDAMSHAILPGVALSFALFGLSILPMTVFALVTGVCVAGVAVLLTKISALKEDGSFTLLYLLSLASGVVLVSRAGSGVDLLHILFGNVLAISDSALYLALGVACISVVVGLLSLRAWVVECFDPDFFTSVARGRQVAPMLFFALVVLNLVAAFQVLGTLMGLGVMLLPALAARFWSVRLDTVIALSIVIGAVSGWAGLLASYYWNVPSGPAIVLVSGGFCVFSVFARALFKKALAAGPENR